MISTTCLSQKQKSTDVESDAEACSQKAKSLICTKSNTEMERHKKGFKLYKNSVGARAAPLVCSLRGMSDKYEQKIDAESDTDPNSTVKGPKNQQTRLWKNISTSDRCPTITLSLL